MNEGWKHLDLEGGGLQTVNLQITQLQKHRLTAYVLWLLFPLGAHRVYLNTSATSLIYVALTAATVILGISVGKMALVPFMAEVAFALFDLYWIDKRVMAINKALRMSLYMGSGTAPPPGYRGRYDADASELLDDYRRIKESERAGIQPAETGNKGHGSQKRIPSFAEQEAMLRQLTKRPARKTRDE